MKQTLVLPTPLTSSVLHRLTYIKAECGIIEDLSNPEKENGIGYFVPIYHFVMNLGS